MLAHFVTACWMTGAEIAAWMLAVSFLKEDPDVGIR